MMPLNATMRGSVLPSLIIDPLRILKVGRDHDVGNTLILPSLIIDPLRILKVGSGGHGGDDGHRPSLIIDPLRILKVASGRVLDAPSHVLH